jgi:hypothetical protein
MKIDVLLNDLEKKLNIFKTESDVNSWLTKNNLSVSITTYKNVITRGNDYIKKSVDEVVKDIEMDLFLNEIDVQQTSSYIENLGVNEMVTCGSIGIGAAAGLCVMFPIAIVPTLIIGGLLGYLGGNASLHKKVCEILVENSEKIAKSIEEQLSPSIKKLIPPPNPIYKESYVDKKTSLDSDEIFNSILSQKTHASTQHDSSKKSTKDTSQSAKKTPIYSKEQLEIKAFLEKRNIKKLVHFTNTKNVESIKKHGILSVQELNSRGIHYDYNDFHRYDRMLDYISLSVTQPNKYVLKSFKENGTLSEVSLIEIDASILYEEISTPRFYCDRNAASNLCKKGSSLRDFEYMFSNDKSYDRYELYRDENEPTDTQAEILFNKKVDPKYIKRIIQL